MKILFPLDPYNQQRQFQKPAWVYPAHLAMYATYLKDLGHEILWGYWSDGIPERVIKSDEDIGTSFNNLPIPDRVLTDAKNKRWQSYGNYLYHPATHMMVSNLCWYGKCSFCIDHKKIANGETHYTRPIPHVIKEIDGLIKSGYKEVFDDSGTFPIGDWFKEFCSAMKTRKEKIVLGCNMKPLRLDYSMFKDAGFRMMLVGLESAKQETVDKLKKGIPVQEAIDNIKLMNASGLEVHVAVMFGYEWESHHDAMQTVELVHKLLKDGHIKSAQASVFMPPRTCPTVLNPAQNYVNKIYSAYKKPWYWSKKLRDMRSLEHLIFLLKRIDHIWRAK